MKFTTRFACVVASMTLSLFLASTAYAQCVGSVCPVDPRSETRGQIGNGLPLPITGAAPGFITNTFMTAGLGTKTGNQVYDAGDRVKPINGAFVNQQDPAPTVAGVHNPSTNPRSLAFPPGQFKSPGPLVKLGVFTFNSNVFQVNTSLLISNPRVGLPSPTLKKGGRTGPATTTWCPGNPIPTGVPGCINATDPGNTFAGLARYTATKNQFGGTGTGKTTGMNAGPAVTIGGSSTVGGGVLPGTANATVYHNFAGLVPPCSGAGCLMAVSVPIPITNGVFGGPFQSTPLVNPSALQFSAIHTGDVGANGTILRLGKFVPAGGPFGNGAWPKQAVTSFGLPGTTGRVTISAPTIGSPEIFVRTGADTRDAGGNGLVSTVGGALSNRQFSGPNANRTWATYYLPEPGALVAGGSALLMLGGCHWLVRRRR